MRPARLSLEKFEFSLTLSSYFLGVNFNQPYLSPNVSWNTNANTFVSGFEIIGLFVDKTNMVYATEYAIDHIHARYENGDNAVQTSFVTPYWTRDVCVSADRYIYANNENDHPVYRWTPDGSSRMDVVMNVTALCFGLFIDLNQNLFCSMADKHQVSSVSLTSTSITPTVVAGTGTAGSAPDMLSSPNGIFVDVNLGLYVADCNNDRVQLFAGGSLYATTVAGTGSTGTISLNHPTDVVLDGNDYLFILDSGNNRIVADGPHGFRCIAACSGGSGGGADQLNGSQSLAFDSHGNLYVTDLGNNRVQKFLAADNSCGECPKCSAYALCFSHKHLCQE